MEKIEMLEKAKAYKNPENREWLYVGVATPYHSSDSGMVEVWALEGTPIRGFIIASREWVVRLDGIGKRLKVYHELDDLYPPEKRDRLRAARR